MSGCKKQVRISEGRPLSEGNLSGGDSKSPLDGALPDAPDPAIVLDAVPGLSDGERERARRELEALPPHDRAYVLRRLGYLVVFWRRDAARGGVRRCETRRELVEQLKRMSPKAPISLATHYRLEHNWRLHGVRGLLPPGPRPGRDRSAHDLIRQAAELLVEAVDVMGAESSG